MIIRNFMQIVHRVMRLNVFPVGLRSSERGGAYILTAPYFFIGKITLGQMTQTVGAFSSVQGALDFFVTSYSTIANYKAVIDRLTTFEAAMQAVQHRSAVGDHVSLGTCEPRSAGVQNSRFRCRTGARSCGPTMSFRQGETTLLTGPSGSGKSTLFRAISEFWPFGHGQILVPDGQSMMLLPQRPYIPMGSLAPPSQTIPAAPVNMTMRPSGTRS